MVESKQAQGRARGLTFWLWVAFGSVLMLLGSPFLIGLVTSAETTGAASATISADPETVWEAILDHQRFPLSAALATEVRPLPGRDDRSAWLEVQQRTTLTVTIVESVPPRTLVCTTSDSESPLDTRWEIELSAAPGGTEVRVEQHCQVRGGVFDEALLRFVLRYLGGARMGPYSYLERLIDSLGGDFAPE